MFRDFFFNFYYTASSDLLDVKLWPVFNTQVAKFELLRFFKE